MTPTYARWSSSPIGVDLGVEDGGLTLATLATASISRLGRSNIAHDSGTHGVEFCFWGDDEVQATVGAVMATAPMSAEVGFVGGVGWRLHAGEIIVNNAVVASGIAVPLKGQALGMVLTVGTPSRVVFYLDGVAVATVQAPVAGAVHFAASMASTKPGGLRCIVNAGQWQGLSPAVAAGWLATEAPAAALRLASEDYMTGKTDSPANVAYVGTLAGDGLDTVASVSFWPWDNISRPGAGQVRVLDAEGLLDDAAIGALRNQPVRVRQVVQGGSLAEAVPVARFVLDRIDIQDDGSKQLMLRDAHDDLDAPLSRAVFLPAQGDSVAWQAQPAVIGTVRSVPGFSVNSDGSQQWLCDAPLASIAVVLDRGAQIAAGTGFSLAAGRQHLVLSSPPLGPVIVDASTQQGMAPTSLRQALEDVFSRIGKSAWSGDDADAIDQATGYAGVGFYGADGATPRDALAALLSSYACDWWQDHEGVLRLARLVDPDSISEGHLDFVMDWPELAEDLVVLPDLAPNLSRRMAYQPNAVALGAGEMITDLVQLPPSMRQQLSGEWRGVAYGGGLLPQRYAHADTAAPTLTRFDRREDAQAEIDRVIALYAVPRNFYAVRVNGRPDLRLRPGQIGRLSYRRYGLQDGRNVLVSGVSTNPVTGEHVFKFWGA